MKLFNTINELAQVLDGWKKVGCTIGFVPTMGALHRGHLSLMERARRENDKIVVSIFVNPLQFGPNEDFRKYPREIDKDLQICEDAGTDVVFAPSVSEMYPEEMASSVLVAGISEGLCGASRPGHFQGVCTVVAKLFNLVRPDRAYFGKKDYQQLAVISKMVRDLNFNIQIVACHIVREEDGLAMSSRNAYLTPPERAGASILNRSLKMAEEWISNGERNKDRILQAMKQKVLEEPLANIDYIEIVDADRLQPLSKIEGHVLIALAVKFGTTRLIDNMDLVV